jgi:hypothetical protein
MLTGIAKHAAIAQHAAIAEARGHCEDLRSPTQSRGREPALAARSRGRGPQVAARAAGTVTFARNAKA